MTRLNDIDQKLEKKIASRVTTILSICVALVLGFFAFAIFGRKYDYCKEALEIKAMSLNGIVVEKVDMTWNHNSHGLKIRNIGEQEIYIALSADANTGTSGQSRLWEQVTPGDSILKQADGFDVQFKKVGHAWSKESLKYDLRQCKD